MLHLKADNLRFTLPSGWHEMTLAQFFKLAEAGESEPMMLAALSGIDVAELRGSAPDLSNLFASHLSYLFDDPNFETLPVPTALIINERPIIPPSNLGTETTFGQKADIDGIRKALNEAGKADNYITMARALLSTYLFPLVTGQRYESQTQAESILPLIDSLPVTDALSLSAFFLSSLNQMMPTGRVKCKVIPHQKITYLSRRLRLWKALTSMILTLPFAKLRKPTVSVR